jgi:acyl-CoA synthetase (AMP-forming)/AMP-acid ligase II
VLEADDALILYTSGTTGQPKGVLLDHHRVIWVGVNSMLVMGLREGGRILHTAPLYHAAQLTMMLTTSSMMNAVHVIVRQFEPGAVLGLMERERISLFFGVPTMYQLLLAHPTFAERDLSHWRTGLFGAAPMPGHVVEQLLEACPQVELIQACGQTEGGPGGIYATPEEVRAKPPASGRFALPNTEARVVGEDENEVPPDSVGELILRGETVMKGYWNRPEATAETLRGGWLRTGDMAHIDADGYITLVDRKKDMIITGGRNVYSVEVENALAAHPDLADCAVVGVPNEKWGESILAAIVPRGGAVPSPDALREHLSAYLSSYKMPHQVVAVDVIPRNASGKILKHVLREQLSAVGGS